VDDRGGRCFRSDLIGFSSKGKLVMTTAPIYPQADPWTVEDLDRLPDGVHHQILDGSLIVLPPPTACTGSPPCS